MKRASTAIEQATPRRVGLAQSCNGHFDQLPQKVLLQIFRYLKATDLATCSSVSKVFYHISNSIELWESLYRLAYASTYTLFCNLAKKNPRAPSKDWKMEFLRKYTDKKCEECGLSYNLYNRSSHVHKSSVVKRIEDSPRLIEARNPRKRIKSQSKATTISPVSTPTTSIPDSPAFDLRRSYDSDCSSLDFHTIAPISPVSAADSHQGSPLSDRTCEEFSVFEDSSCTENALWHQISQYDVPQTTELEDYFNNDTITMNYNSWGKEDDWMDMTTCKQKLPSAQFSEIDRFFASSITELL